MSNFDIGPGIRDDLADLHREVTVNVSLTAELDAFIHQRVATGRYGSASEVVRDALRALGREEEVRDEARKAIGAMLDRRFRDVAGGTAVLIPAEQVYAEMDDLLGQGGKQP